MKKLEILGYLICGTGFTLKLFHIHFHTYVILVGLVYLFGYFLYSLISKNIQRENLFLGLSTTFFFMWLLFLGKFFPMPFIPMSLALLCLVIGVFLKSKRGKAILDGRQWINLMILIICLIIFQLPKNKRYYLLNVRFNYEIETDFITWDKYSFFLYLDGNYNEALMANEKAMGIANFSGEKEWVNQIMEHRSQISSKNWKRY